MRFTDHIKSLASVMKVDETKACTCTKCQSDWESLGRPSNWRPERSMSITRSELGLLYFCFRASCGFRGFVPAFTYREKPSSKATFKQKVYKYRTVPANPEHIPNDVYLTEGELASEGVLYSPDRDTVVYPVYGQHGYEVAKVDRSYNGRKPKTILYREVEADLLHFPRNYREGESVAIVEDIPSSIALGRHIPSVALMGTHFRARHARLLRGSHKNLLIVLDADAYDKAAKYCQKFELFFTHVHAVFIEKDIKNQTPAELEALWNNLSSELRWLQETPRAVSET